MNAMEEKQDIYIKKANDQFRTIETNIERSDESLTTVQTEIINIKTSMETDKREEKQQIEKIEAELEREIRKLHQSTEKGLDIERSDYIPDIDHAEKTPKIFYH